MFRAGLLILFVVTSMISTGCQTVRAFPIEENSHHIYVSRTALHIGLDHAFIGNATLQQAINDLKKEAKNRSAVHVEIVRSDVNYNFWRFFPFSLLIQPVVTKVSANIELSPSNAEPVASR